ncbi:U4/U6 small nuclear ribonucleoprotein Prp4 [Skeletonema marinoi]|uniref:U4/U6 small nuclear ribonucleoprotein Prp4 n=1 Tax=Skeletonema marinoi TaxID=267567 RepID=A0AAD8YF39_9STRA|nr:U4/U6 small nuclear ribonucleoprotein Prp4 [Skeletonema marinoi]
MASSYSAAAPSSGGVEYLELTSDSLAAQQSHRLILLDIEARKRASTIDVPTLPADVRDRLREMGEPIRMFGEDLAAIRDRLRMILARWEVWKEQHEKGLLDGQMEVPRPDGMVESASAAAETRVEITETTYSHAPQELIDAREIMCKYSLGRSRYRLEMERRRRRGMIRWTRSKKRARLFDKDADDDADEAFGSMYHGDNLKQDSVLVKDLDDNCEKIYTSIRNQALEGSQYGDVRPLSAVCTSSLGNNSHLDYTGPLPKIIATGGWSGGIKIWNGGKIIEMLMGTLSDIYYFDRRFDNNDSICIYDLSAKLCKVTLNEDAAADSMDVDDGNKAKNNQQLRYNIEECAHLKGHAARLCSVAFHPTGRFVATTSFDHTWRLWDVETSSMAEGKELLLQDGHAREVYGVGFHPDGSLVSTTDFGGVVQCWDLRTGKSACHFLGHAKRVVCSEFSPNGFQLATAGDDGTIKIWDLRRRRPSASIPAHTNLITQLKFSHSTSSQNGEFLVSSSFDGTGKIWSTRDWKLLSTLEGHEGKVMGIDVLDGRDCGVVTCGFDKTLKLWK